MSRKMFEAAQSAHEALKKIISQEWEALKKRFEGSKKEMAQEIMKAETLEDMIALGKKMIEQAEAMKDERDALESEKAGETEKQKAKETEMINEAHGEENEMNRQIDENKAAEEAAKEKARIAEEDRLKAVEEAEQLAAVRAKLNGESMEAPAAQESAEPVAVENGSVENAESAAEAIEKGRHDWESDPEFEALKKTVIEVNTQSGYNEEADKKARDLTNELFPRLQTTEDFKEVTFFLAGETRNAAYEKWDELTEKEIKEASSEDDMKRALKNMSPVIGRSKGDELRGIAYDKFPSLREYFMNREPAFFYLKDALKWEEKAVEKGRERLADLEKNGQQESEEYKKLHRLLVKTVDGSPVLKSMREIPDAVEVNDVLKGE